MLLNLRDTLQKVISRDPEQRIRGISVGILDAAIGSIRDVMPTTPLVAQIKDVISPENVNEGEPLRAIDVLFVVDILIGALPERPRPMRRV